MNIRLSESEKAQSYTGPGLIAATMHRILMRENRRGRVQEHFWVIGLNNANRILYIELVALGRQNRVAVSPPDIFRTALCRMALRVILVHNHPSGTLRASEGDKSVTDQLLKAGELIGIEVLDHLIITASGGFLSFRDDGILDELRRCQRWRLLHPEQYETQQMLQACREKEMVREAEQHARLSIAMKLKDTGMDAEGIRQLTGLRLPEIRCLQT